MGQMKLEDIVETILPLHKKIIKCRNCGLWKERQNAVPGEGDPNARLLIIGEAPGKSEDELGRPFVGRAGKVLNEVLTEVGINRNEVFITNIIKCRPPRNRVPKKNEVVACSEYLKKQIEIIEPELIVALGHSAFRTLTGMKGKMEDFHGKKFDYNKHKVLVTYHPAALIYNRKLRPLMIEDLRTEMRNEG